MYLKCCAFWILKGSAFEGYTEENWAGKTLRARWCDASHSALCSVLFLASLWISDEFSFQDSTIKGEKNISQFRQGRFPLGPDLVQTLPCDGALPGSHWFAVFEGARATGREKARDQPRTCCSTSTNSAIWGLPNEEAVFYLWGRTKEPIRHPVALPPFLSMGPVVSNWCPPSGPRPVCCPVLAAALSPQFLGCPWVYLKSTASRSQLGPVHGAWPRASRHRLISSWTNYSYFYLSMLIPKRLINCSVAGKQLLPRHTFSCWVHVTFESGDHRFDWRSLSPRHSQLSLAQIGYLIIINQIIL